jgi:hypothetical protein
MSRLRVQIRDRAGGLGAMLLLSAVMLGLAACGGGSQAPPTGQPQSHRATLPPPTSRQSADAGDGKVAELRAASLPDSERDVTAVLGRMPAQISGLSRQSPGRGEVRYGTPRTGASLVITSLVEAAGPNHDMPTFFERFAVDGQISVQQRNTPTSRLLFLTGPAVDPARGVAAAWARRDGHWLFGVEAANPALLSDLINAFHAAM